MTLVDTHAHIYVDEFSSDVETVIRRAGEAHVSKILMPAIDSSTHEKMLAAEQRYPSNCISMMGLHPCSVKENYQDELRIVADHLGRQSFIAVGEIGLDFYWDRTYTDQQYDAFHQQVELALHYDIPVVIHSREATDACIGVIREHQKGNLKGVFHCFSGTMEQARQVIDAGMYLGIGGVLTYKNAGLDKVVKEIGPRHLVLETDSPYLAPVPFRGKRNECAYIYNIAQKLADVKEMSIAEIAEITTSNAEKLFGL